MLGAKEKQKGIMVKLETQRKKKGNTAMVLSRSEMEMNYMVPMSKSEQPFFFFLSIPFYHFTSQPFLHRYPKSC